MGRKGKAAPASSAKALEICGDTSKLGVSPADVFAQFGKPVAQAADDPQTCLDDVEVSLALQALQKKDPTTRLRAVVELRELLVRPGAGPLSEVCAPFLHIYRRLWPQDNEPRVREGMQRCLLVLVENLQREFAKHLRSAFPTWLCAMFDTHAEVTQAGRTAFTSAFPTDEKRRGVFRHCQKDCLELLTSNLRHSEQSLHDELGLPASGDKDNNLQRQDRYARVLAASLSALGELVHVCSAGSEGGPGASLSPSQLERFFGAGSPCAVWPRLASKQPAAIRRAAVQCLLRIFRAVGKSSGESGCGTQCEVAPASHRAAALNVMADEAIAPAVAAAFVKEFAVAGEESNCWEGLVASKSLWPPLTALLRRGAAGGGRRDVVADFLQRFGELLQVLPASAWAPGKAELLLSEILQSLAQARGSFAAAAEDAWKAYFAVCSAAGVHVSAEWRWHPLTLFLGGRPAASDTPESDPPQVTLPPVVRAPLPAVFAAALTSEAMEELVGRLASVADTLQVGDDGEGPSLRRWTTLAQTLQSAKVPAVEASLQRLVTAQLRRLLLETLLTDPTAEVLDALRAVLACAVGDDLDSADAELTQALGSSSPEGAVVIPGAWPKEARFLAWPILPWISALQRKADGHLSAAVGEKVLRPLLADLARSCRAAPAGLMERLCEVLLPTKDEADSSFQARSLRLALDCVPKEYALASTERVHQVVSGLVDVLVAQGTCLEDVAFMDEAVRALTLAFRPPPHGGMDAAQTAKFLKRLLSVSAQSAAATRRLSLIVSNTLSQREAGEIEELGELLAPASVALLRVLLSDGTDEEASQVLPRLLVQAGVEASAQILAENWPNDSGLDGWVGCLLEAAEQMLCPALSLLCKARRVRRGSSEGRLLPAGVITAGELHDNAVITGLVLRGLHGNDLDDGLDDGGIYEVVWELLLSASLSAEDVVVSSAAQAWTMLQSSSDATKLGFLGLALEEAASEGGLWHVSNQGESALPLSAHLASLSPLRHMLAALWTNSERAEALGAPRFLSWALSQEAQNGTLGWGWTAATIIRQSATAGVLESAVLSAALAQCRACIRNAPITGEAQITEQHLIFATVLEELSQATEVETPETRHVEANSKSTSDGPVITEVLEQSKPEMATEPEAQEDMDTSLVESIEKLLRWSQAKACRADSFAAYAAALWPAVAKADSTAGRLAHRMIRLTQETLGIGTAGLASALAAGAKAPAATGVWQLVAALCRAGHWPEANWPSVLQATAKASQWLLAAHEDSNAPVSDAFVDDAWAATAALLPFVPEALAPQLAPLLSAPDGTLRAAAARRLQGHGWLPSRAELGDQSSKNGEGQERKDSYEAWSAVRALQNLEALLQADSQPPEVLGSPTSLPSCADVAFVVVGAVFGQELTSALWSVEDALSGVAAWEVSEEDSEEELDKPGGGTSSTSQRGYGRRFRASPTEEGAADEPVSADPATPATSSRGRRRAWLASEEQLPLPSHVEHACAASLAAWETVLRGIEQGLQEKDSCRAATSSEKDGASPAELLTSVLQLTPDHLSKSEAASVFPVQVAPPSHWEMPLLPLLRLLCHLLTSSRLTGFCDDEDGSAAEAKVSASLNEVGDRRFDLLPLAARTLLLALRLAPGGARRFWEQLPRKRDQALVERLISRSFSHLLIQAEASAANAQLEADRDRLEDIEASVIRRQRQLLLLLQREELRTELSVNLPPSFPLRPAQAEFPEKLPGIPKPRARNWMLQARQLLSGSRPAAVGKAVLMWSKSFALFFKGVEDCPICYNVIQLTTQTIPRKACPTCKHKFHNECLYQWFRSSSKTTCPLCNQPF